ncbi:MAG: hypothetical protein IJK96_04990 [Bacteroidales bacterium]|nr:hypothetical protein [Bacteroidales bacterium]
MVGNGHIELRSLTMDELAGVVNLYPWYAGARKELCRRMSGLGGENWGKEQYSDSALYFGSRKIVSDLVRSKEKRDWSDKDLKGLLKSFVEGSGSEESRKKEGGARAGAGDYFSQSQYDSVRQGSDGIFSKFASKASSGPETPSGPLPDFCTETLASIYAEQGYFEQAARIYSKLILLYPEKSAYFASLLEKTKTKITD